mmetsp:Transcript_5048/g.11372  ORF Transcript_5048/g.11372 Transcript_5048/m.11372 type:complete len:106 (-) Transcript_5048:368-685(-)
MLRPSSRPSLVAGSKPGGNNMDNLDEFDKAYDNLESVQPLGQQKARIANHEEPSLRFWKIRKRSTEEIARELTNPKKLHRERNRRGRIPSPELLPWNSWRNTKNS